MTMSGPERLVWTAGWEPWFGVDSECSPKAYKLLDWPRNYWEAIAAAGKDWRAVYKSY